MALIPPNVTLDSATASFMASGLRALAEVDGGHERELALVAEFEGDGGPADPSAFNLSEGHPLQTPSLRDLFLRSALLLALADGRVSHKERETLTRWAQALGVDPVALAYMDREVRMSLLGGFQGVTLFREQAIAVGRELGLDDSDIELVLSQE